MAWLFATRRGGHAIPAMPTRITNHFAALPDPRVDRTKDHHLLDILIIALCAVVCGAVSFVEIEQFGNAKRDWLTRFLALPHGIPSHDTFGRVFAALDPDAFSRYDLTRLTDAEAFGRAGRARVPSGQVGMENGLHWVIHTPVYRGRTGGDHRLRVTGGHDDERRERPARRGSGGAYASGRAHGQPAPLPPESLVPFGIYSRSPDAFLVGLYEAYPNTLAAMVCDQAA